MKFIITAHLTKVINSICHAKIFPSVRKVPVVAELIPPRERIRAAAGGDHNKSIYHPGIHHQGYEFNCGSFSKINKYVSPRERIRAVAGAKIAEALNVTIDYLVKDAEYQNIDNETLKRMKGLERLSKEDKGHVFAMLDAFLAKSKLQSILR